MPECCMETAPALQALLQLRAIFKTLASLIFRLYIVRLRIPGLPTAALRQKIFRDTAWHASPSTIYCILVCCSRQIPDKCEAHPLTFKLLELWSLRKKTPVCNREESSSLDHNRMYWLYLYKTRWVSMCAWVRNWGPSALFYYSFWAAQI